jgi:hypothetical protein
MRRLPWFALGLLVLSPPSSAAQAPARSFEQLQVLVAPGETLSVTDATGREVTGRLAELTSAALTLELDGGARTWEVADVRRVRQRHGDSLLNGTLIGAGVGAGLIGTAIVVECSRDDTTCDGFAALAFAIYTAAGAGVGALVDAAIRGRRVVFEAPPPGPSPSVALAPVVSPHGAALHVLVRF